MIHPLALIAAMRGRFRALFRRGSLEQRLSEDVRFHLEMETEKNLRAGMSGAEARRAALVAFGGVDRVSEAHRDVRGTRLIEEFVYDARHAVRVLARTPAFVAVSVLTLAVAIAVGTSLFSAANGFVYRPLQVPKGAELISVFTSSSRSAGDPRGGSSYADLISFEEEVEAIAELTGESRFSAGIGMGDEVELMNGALVTSDYFATLRVRPALGRFPRTAHGADPAIVLSYGTWQRRFAADASLLGRHVSVNGHAFRVAAIAPPEFLGTSREFAKAFWIDASFAPLLLPRSDVLRQRDDRRFKVVGRLRQGHSLDALQARLATVAARLYQDDPESWGDDSGRGRRVTVMFEREAFFALIPRRDKRLMVGGVAALGLGLLAIASANLASLQLARAAVRRREIATRLALGASRGRLIRQLLTESAVVALPGVLIGLTLTSVIARLMMRYRLPEMPNLNLPLSLSALLDPRALLFTATGVLLALLVFGLLPALQSARNDVLTDLKEGGQAGRGGVRIGRVRGGLIIVQVALSVVFAASSGLIALALARNANDRRIDAGRVVVAPLTLLPAVEDSLRAAALIGDILREMERLPGVESVTAARLVPNAGSRLTIAIKQREVQAPDSSRIVEANLVRPGYFGVVGLPVLRGRDFEEREMSGHLRVALASSALADRLWPGVDPMGKRLLVNDAPGEVEIVGVVGELQDASTASHGTGLLYLPLQPEPEGRLVLHLRVNGAGTALGASLAHVLRAHSALVAPSEVMSMARYMDRANLGQRAAAGTAGVLASLQLLLAIAGLSGLVAYATAQRRREIGIRAALGARRAAILKLVLLQGLRLVGIGAAIGIVLSLVVGRVVATMLPVTAAIESSALGMALLCFALAAGAAMLLPARRALAEPPAAALRVD